MRRSVLSRFPSRPLLNGANRCFRGVALTHPTRVALHFNRRGCHTISGASVIHPDDITFVSEPSSSAEAHTVESVGLACARSVNIPKSFQEVVEVDNFARARVVAFIKRYDKTIQDASSIFVVNELQDSTDSRKLYHCCIAVPIQYTISESDAINTLYAHGISFEQKEAEQLAAMHAEYMIDFLGFHIYTLENMQRKHALSARKQGRHAPSPDDQQVARHSFQHFPLPLRRAAKDETEGGRWQLLGEPQEYNFVSPPHALLSPCVVDPAAVTRIRNVLYTVDFNLHHLCVTKRLKGRSNNIPVYYESEILLPQALIGKHNLKARGKATNKQLSLELACMHAELILDALGVCIFPNDNEAQRDHAMSCWQYGRPAPLPGTAPKLPSEVNLPAPLKVVSSVGRAAPLSEEERLTRDHVTLGRQCDEMTDTTVLESNAIGTLGRFLKERSFTRVGDPFFQELLPNGKTKSTIVLPLPSSYGIRGGVGIATVPANANVLAAMHALDVLSVLGIPVSENDPLNESVRWAVLRHEHFGSPLFEKSPDPQAVSPPGRRESVNGLSASVNPEKVGSTLTASCEAPVSASESPTPVADKPRRTVKRAKVVEATPEEKNTPEAKTKSDPLREIPKDPTKKHCWNLEADTADGYIMVDAIASGTELMGEAVFSPRKLDRDAQKRVGQYLNDLGRRFEDVFTLSNSEGSTSHKDTFTCAAALPLPAQFGQRMAVGVAPSMTEAMQLAAMHAELILDTLGVRLFQSDEKQEMHARNCAKVGRFAPLPKEGTSVPPDTPSPPPLKMHASQKRKVKRLSPIKEAVKKEENDDDEEVDTEAGVEETPAVPAVPEVRHVSVSESEVDTLCKNRVSYYLARQKKKQPDSFTDEVCFEVTMGKGMVLHRCILSIPLPDKTVREAEGFANTKKDAEVMAWMHAERVLDTLNIPLFDNLPGLQRYHSERVRKLGRSAPAIIQAKQKTITEDPLYPLHLEYSPTTAALPKPVCPSPNDAEDDAKWDKYVQDCIEYIQYKKYVDSNLFFDIERVPRTGDRVIDAALLETESAPPLQNVKQILQLYCNAAKYTYPGYWHTHKVGSVTHRVQYTRVAVPGYEFLFAEGVGANKETSERRAATHALNLLKRIDPNYADYYGEAMDKASPQTGRSEDAATMIAELDLPVVNIKSVEKAETKKQKKSQAARVINTWDTVAKDYTLDGKRQLVHLFTVCAGVPPPSVTEYVTSTSDGALPQYRTVVCVKDEEGKDVVGEGKGSGPNLNTDIAYERLFLQLSEKTALMRRLTSMMKSFQNTNMRAFPSLSLTEEQKKGMREIVDKLLPAAETASPVLAHEADAGETVEDDNNLSLFRESEKTQLSGELLAKLQAKVTNSDYLERYAKRRQSLSISEKREEILSAIKESNVVIICGTTGCGKTTQVPQFILDKATEDGEGGECSILVTQPRRLSAVSIAQRVAAERLEDVGDTCGYAVRFDSKRGTSINFCTTGILMRTLHNDPMLSHINYLIIDEIHERDVNSDFLLILVREVLKTRTDLKVILMSATLQAKQFGDYFGNVPIINVEGYMFPVKELFLEDLATMASEEGISSPLLKQASAMADSMEEQKLTQDVTDWLEEDRKEMERKEGHAKYNILVADTEIDFVALQFAVQQAIKMTDLSNSSILVFLPGWEEISRAKDILERDSRFDIVCLHSSISVHEQQRCFLPPEEGKIKLILSTNIAESGVTIDDVGAVIDLGRSKEKTFFARKGNTTSGKNVEGNVSQLLTVYASHANCVQRRGRVGRTRPGVCLRLYTKRHFDTLHQFQTPEILRTPLESLCLQVLALRLGEPRRFLNLALEPPEGDSTASAMSRLEYLGAVTTGGDLTPLGNTLSKLPVHPRWGKLVVMGVFFQALDATLTMASLADSDAFVTNREVREAVRLYREHFSCDSQSDYIANLNAYYFWIAARDKLPSAELTTTLGVRHISVPQLLLASRTKQQFYNILVGSKTIRGTIANSPDEQFNEAFVEQSAYSQESSSCNLIKSLLASCLFPDLCMSYGKQLLRSKTELHISPSRDSVVRKAKYDEEDQRFYVYAELSLSQETEKLLARNLSHSPFWALLLFTPPNVAVTHDLTTNIGVVDDWIPFHMKYADFELVKKFKTCLHYAIGTAMHQPLDILQREEFNTIRSLVKDLLNAPETTQTDHVRQTGTIVSPSDALAQFLLSKKREDSEAAAETTETPTESETA